MRVNQMEMQEENLLNEVIDVQDPVVALVYNQDDDLAKGDEQDLIAVQDTAKTADSVFQALCQLGYSTIKVPVRGDLQMFAQDMSQYSPHNTFVFNISDGLGGDNSGASRVARAIEELGFAHTGATGAAVERCTDKARAKRHLIRRGVPTPAYQVFKKPAGDVALQFPAIVKPVAEDASMGIDVDSVVTNPNDLFHRVDYVVSEYRQPALVEEFIEGREFAISMFGNGKVECLPIVEEDFSQVDDPLKHFLPYESKWIEDSFLFRNITAVCPAPLADRDLAAVEKAAAETFRAMGLRDFGRVDVRYREGVPYVIDINEIPDLSPESGFPRSAGVAGYTYEAMIERILRLAMHREGWTP